MKRGMISLGTAALLALLAIGCSEHEAADDEGHSVTGPSGETGAPGASPAASPSPAATPSPAASPGAVTIAYVQDVQPILRTDCTRCHGSFDSYAGTMGFVQPGDPSSPLVVATQPGGAMRSYLSGNAAAKADLIRRWVVDNAAAESR